MSRNTFSNSHALSTIQGGSNLPRKAMQSKNNNNSSGVLKRNNDSQNNRTSTADAEYTRPKMIHLSRSLRRMKRRLLLEAVANPNFQTGSSSSSSASASSSWLATSSSSFSSSSFDYGSSRRLRVESNDSLPSLDEEEEDENEV